LLRIRTMYAIKILVRFPPAHPRPLDTISLVNRKAGALGTPFSALTTILPRFVLRDPYNGITRVLSFYINIYNCAYVVCTGRIKKRLFRRHDEMPTPRFHRPSRPYAIINSTVHGPRLREAATPLRGRNYPQARADGRGR